MVFSVFGWKSAKQKTAEKLYDSIVAQARKRDLYAYYMVPDTIEGRFEMIVLHIFLVLQKLKEDEQSDDELGKLLLERFFSDMDDSLREMGVGDLTVPKKIKKLADSMYGRLYGYAEAIETADREKIGKLLEEGPFNKDTGEQHASATSSRIRELSNYIFKRYEIVKRYPIQNILNGEVSFIAN